MGRADRQTDMSRRQQHDSGSGFSREAMDRFQLHDSHAEGSHDPPPADRRAEPHRQGAGTDHPGGHFRSWKHSGGHQRQRDDAHGLLRIVRPVAECHETGRDQLHA